jgi:hypothetical protein
MPSLISIDSLESKEFIDTKIVEIEFIFCRLSKLNSRLSKLNSQKFRNFFYNLINDLKIATIQWI